LYTGGLFRWSSVWIPPFAGRIILYILRKENPFSEVSIYYIHPLFVFAKGWFYLLVDEHYSRRARMFIQKLIGLLHNPRKPENGAAIQVALVEYESLRKEIETRTVLSNALTSGIVIGVIAALATADDLGYLAIALSIGISILWLFWMDHALQIYKIAGYISIKLNRQIQYYTSTAFRWELFLRSLDSDDNNIRKEALYDTVDITVSDEDLRIRKTEIVRKYSCMLYLISPIIFLLIFYVSKIHTNLLLCITNHPNCITQIISCLNPDYLSLGLMIISVFLIIYSVQQYLHVQESINNINIAIKYLLEESELPPS
jgi:hypothetical protein